MPWGLGTSQMTTVSKALLASMKWARVDLASPDSGPLLSEPKQLHLEQATSYDNQSNRSVVAALCSISRHLRHKSDRCNCFRCHPPVIVLSCSSTFAFCAADTNCEATSSQFRRVHTILHDAAFYSTVLPCLAWRDCEHRRAERTLMLEPKHTTRMALFE
jgi:hypothetical protein